MHIQFRICFLLLEMALLADAEPKGPTKVEDVLNWESVVEKYLSIQGGQANFEEPAEWF